jgi:hypothetical protein
VNQLEIALKEVNGEPVSLKSMSSDALESFMSVMSSLKAIAIAITDKDDLSFSITEGSAQGVLEAPSTSMDLIYEELDIAMKGESYNKEVTSNLKNIQDQIKRQNFNYGFLYRRTSQPTIDIYSTLFNSNKISLKRRRNQFGHKLQIKSGFLNQIGGNTPNYHFNSGERETITISCTIEEAKSINKYLYVNVQSLLLCKEWYEEDKKDEYVHKAIIEDELANKMKTYLNSYNKEIELVRKLTLTHDFIDDMFNDKIGYEILHYLLIAFNDKNFHLSELKTLLVISKPFKDLEKISEARVALQKTYEEKRAH